MGNIRILIGEGLNGYALRRSGENHHEPEEQVEWRLQLWQLKYMLVPLAVGFGVLMVIFGQ